jgi:hypothetical protein
MKKGKSVNLNLFNPIKSVYGTVDSKNLKSIYINIQSWVTPKEEYDNWNRVVSTLGREIKNSVSESINPLLFQENNIVDLDLRTSGIRKGKKTFFNLEINLYTSTQLEFKCDEIKDSIKDIVKSIYQNNVTHNKYFEFSNSKKDKVI